MEIRDAIKSDKKQISEIYYLGSLDELKLQHPGKKKLIKEGAEKSGKKISKDFTKTIESKKVNWIVVEDKEEVIAFSKAKIDPDDKSKGHLGKMYITQEYRRKGLAIKLAKIQEKWLKSKGVKEAGSWILSKNIPSQKFHEKAGYETNAYWMIKKL